MGLPSEPSLSSAQGVAGDSAALDAVAGDVRFQRFRKFLGNKAAVTGAAILLVIVTAALAAPLITSYNPSAQDLSASFAPVSGEHWLGTDSLGRDIFARILYGGRATLFVGAAAVAIAFVIGVPLGIISGYVGGVTDLVIQRVTDIMLSFNFFLLALLLVAVFGVGLGTVTLAAGVGVVPEFIRVARSEALRLRHELFVDAARTIGAGAISILTRHVLRNATTPIIVYATLSVGTTILVAAGLGFLGLGVQPPTPEWGSMLGDARTYLFHNSMLMFYPGFAIFLTVLSVNLFGDGLRDAFDANSK